jgi:hypothetical protein
MKAKVPYWVRVTSIAVLISAFAVWTTTDSFNETLAFGTGLGLEAARLVLKWICICLLALFIRWYIVGIIADGVAMGITKTMTPKDPSKTPKWLERPAENDHSPWAETKRAYYEASAGKEK